MIESTTDRAEGAWRDLAPRTLARLVRTYGSGQFELCEDAVQDALLDAFTDWPSRPPDDPAAWLVATARRRYIDRVRSDSRRRARESREALLQAPLANTGAAADDSLLLLELCCQPELPRSAQVALTLRAVAGLSTVQIANAYQLPEATIAQRITRAKRRLTELGRRLPHAEDRRERLGAVLDVLYVMFTEAHHSTSGAPVRDADLAAEAINLARRLRRAAPDQTEVTGLLALMLLTEARHPARIDNNGRLVQLEEQDRGSWNRDYVVEGLMLVDRAVPGAVPGPYLLQACIAALHAQATDTESTDWPEILALYGLLEIATEHLNPTISLNRVVAVAMVHGPSSALAELDTLAAQHPGLPRLEGVRAQLLERAAQPAAAVAAYRRAIQTTRNVAEREQLRVRLRRVVGRLSSGMPLP